MSSTAARELYLCPECEGGVGQSVGDNEVLCSTCGHRFAVSARLLKPRQAPVKPGESSSSSGAGGIIARNVVSKNREDKALSFQQMESVPSREVEPGEVRQRRRRRGRKKKSLRDRLLMVLIWLGCLALVLLAVNSVRGVFESIDQTDSGFVTRLSAEEKAFYFQEKATVFNVLASFLQARTVERKSNFVAGSTRVVASMGPYYERNEMRLPGGALDGDPVFWNLEAESKPPYLEAVWRDSSGGSFEAVFLFTESGWKIDWPQFRRLSDEDWTYFRQRFSNTSESNFRLWVDLSNQRLGEESEMISFRFLPPVADSRLRELEASPYLKAKKSTKVGQYLTTLLSSDEEEAENGLELKGRDPSELHRVQVKLEWSIDPITEEPILSVQEFLADHWRSLSID